MKSFAALSMLCAVAMLTGCATVPTGTATRQTQKTETPQTFAERKREAVIAFERQRDAAQVHAAINYWQRGDVQKSLAMLTALVERVPTDFNARLRLAEVLTAQEDFAGAEVQLRECLIHAPNSAEVQHTLGMLLTEGPGREQEAQTYLRRAAELDPDNELYAASAS